MRVLVIGDPPDMPGGIAQVMTLVDSWCQNESSIETTFLNPLGKKHPSGYPNLASFFISLKKLITKRPDVVHFNTASRGSTYRNVLFSVFVRMFRIPYIIHLHGGGYPKFVGELSKAQMRLILSYFRHAESVIALTPSWSEFLATQLAVNTSRIAVIPNGTADPGPVLTTGAEKAATPTFVYAGRLTKAKGVPELIRGFHALPEGMNARLILIGGSTDKSVSAELDKSTENIIQLGWRTNHETLTEMAAAWAVVLPSHFENMPLTVLESMSVSTAVIATRVGGIPEMIRDNVDGILIPPCDVHHLTQSMKVLCQIEAAIEYGASGRARWLQSYTSERMILAIIDQWKNAQK